MQNRRHNKMYQIRSIQGLSLDRISERTGISKSHLSSIERGFLNPSFTHARAIAEVFGLPVREVFAETIEEMRVTLKRWETA